MATYLIFFLFLALPFALTRWRDPDLKIHRVPFIAATLVLLLIGAAETPPLVTWLSLSTYGVLCALRVSTMNLDRSWTIGGVLIPGALLIAWPYFAFFQGPRMHPMHHAAAEGDVQSLQNLLNGGAKIDCRGPNGITPLMLAAMAGDVNAVTWLLSKGADPSLTLLDKITTAESLAAARKHRDVLIAFHKAMQAQAHRGAVV